MRITILVILLLSTLSSFSQKTAAVQNVDAATFRNLIDKKEGMLIDLRTPDETKKGVIKGATEIDFLAKDFEEKISKLDKKKAYYLYCQGGGRSADAAEFMVQHGFTTIVNLEKGYGGWLKQGYATEIRK